MGLAGHSCAKLKNGAKHPSKQKVNRRQKCFCIAALFQEKFGTPRYHATVFEKMMETPILGAFLTLMRN
jgi:hypothetical protein